jgi:D-beta-D-heptose 7-phosphate kinase/D-beta-D-heptose 1-phosphate adenosyltransferase
MKTVVISGGFDPIHSGHINYIKEASKLGDKLIVILNSDNWLKLKKGYVFMKEEDRKIILENIKGVDEVIISSHKEGTKDLSVCEDLRKIKPYIFANGGDRFADNIPEAILCKELGIKTVFNVGGEKTLSSSELVADSKK